MTVCRFLIFSFFFTYVAGQFAECGSNCIFLRECPAMLKLASSGAPANIRLVREAICGFKNRSPKVCCLEKSPISEIPPNVATTSLNKDGENLLPKDCGNPITEDRIFSGTIAPIGAYPWMVALGYTDVGVRGDPQFICSGALIGSRYVLTAAHCIDKGALGTRRLSVIHLGDWDLSTDKDCQVTNKGQKCSSHIVAGDEELILHPMYDKRGQTSDDIGLIRLNISVNFRDPKVYAKPVCLPPSGLSAKTVAQGRDPLAAGWGLTEHGNQSNVLLRVNLPFSDNSICKDVYDTRFLENDQLCVGGAENHDTCSGDSGGPLVLPGPTGPPYLQIGIVSYGSLPCALGNIPAVYTAVSGYREWIIENLKP